MEKTLEGCLLTSWMVDGFVLSLEKKSYHGRQSSHNLMSGIDQIPQSGVRTYTLRGEMGRERRIY